MHLNWLLPAFELKHSITYILYIDDCNASLTRILKQIAIQKSLVKNLFCRINVAVVYEKKKQGETKKTKSINN